MSSKTTKERTLGPSARFGLAAVGVSYALVAVLALQLALGQGGGATDRDAALSTVARTRWGLPILLVIALGFAAYALWRIALAVTGEGIEGEDKGWLKRIGYAGRGALYSGLAIATVRSAFSRGRESGGNEKQDAAMLMGWPGGRWILGLVGLAFIAASAYCFFVAITRRYEDRLKTWKIPDTQQRLVNIVGVLGYLARTVVFGIMGWFLVRAAVTHDPDKSIGLGGALQQLLSKPYGRLLLGIVAFGLLSYGVFRWFEARYRTV